MTPLPTKPNISTHGRSRDSDDFFGHCFAVYCSEGHGYKKPGIRSTAFPNATMPRLNATDRERAIGMVMAGTSAAEVARRFGVHKSTIMRLQRRLQQTGTTRDRPRSGQPRVTTPAQDRHIRATHLRDRFRVPAETAAQTVGRNRPRISYRTVTRRLRERGIRAYRAQVGLVLTRPRRANRLRWARNHANRNWPNANWRRVVFSDESRFHLYRNDGRRRVYRRRGERTADPCVRQVDRFGGGSVMVWGAIRAGWRSPLVIIEGALNAVRYRDEILAAHVIPYVANHPDVIFMHDNARPHVARICQAYLAGHNVNVMDWPPYSPDMNAIEHMWDILGRRLQQRVPQPVTRAQLGAALVDEWNNIPQYQINRLVNSMPRRIQTLLNANGGHTRY